VTSTPPAAELFPPAAQQAFGLVEVVNWIAESVDTPAGNNELRKLCPSIGAARRQRLAARGGEALAAVAGQENCPTRPCADLSQLLAWSAQRALAGEELAAISSGISQFQEVFGWICIRPHMVALNACCEQAADLGDLSKLLHLTVDHRGEVLDSADVAIGPLRADIRAAERKRAQLIGDVAEKWRAQGLLESPRPTTRGERPVLAVKATSAGRAKGVLHDRSRSGDTVFIEPEAAVFVSNKITSMQARLAQVIQRVLLECTRSVLHRRFDIEHSENILGKIDLAFGCAKWSQKCSAAWPDSVGQALVLRQLRHPLLIRQLGFENVIPLDLELGGDFDLMVVTGPNTGGKTVVLKTVGLAACMGACGLPVTAAEGTVIPSLPGIDADIGDQQSLESSLSTFSGHLQRILRILENAQAGSLVLLDELGTGTDPKEGSALGRALLEELLARGVLVIANTHLGALKVFSIELARAENASMEFDPKSLSPNYRLLVGVPGASHALEVADQLGLPKAILERAQELCTREGGAEDLLAEVAEVRRHAENMRSNAREAEADARDSLRSAEEQEQASRFRAGLREREAQMAYRDLRARLVHLLEVESQSALGQMSGPARAAFTQLRDQLNQACQESDLQELWTTFIKGIKRGETVYLPRYRERVRVIKIDRKRHRARLQHGQLEIEVHLSEISWVEPPPGEDPPSIA